MKFEQYYSSSFGNLYMVTANSGKRLMVECGVTWAKLQKALNYDFNGIVGCLVTHEHQDHSKAVKDVLLAGINVYSSKHVFSRKQLDYERRAYVIKDKDLIRLGDFEVLCFHVEHDCDGCLGFVVREKATNEFLLFATDTSHIIQRFKYQFSIIAIECSYDKKILQYRVDTKDINESLAARLLTSHMEKTNTMKYISDFCDLTKCREIHLLHLSSDNLDNTQTKTDFEKKFFIETEIK